MNKTLGLYVHIPFCRSKCAYCDFYSQPSVSEAAQTAYVRALEQTAEKMLSPAEPYRVASVYLGGGTPSALTPALFARVLAATQRFRIEPAAEVTAEANPAPLPDGLFDTWARCGVNRVSIGMQSAVEPELRAVGRRHTCADVAAAVSAARRAGIRNISLDLMLGLPGQTQASVERSISFALSLMPEHLSLYCLKLEPGTPLERLVSAGRVTLPDDEAVADWYLDCCGRLTAAGLAQYEISNFARAGFESRHNLRYWQRGDYLGIGAAAHSFFAGVRRFFPSDRTAFQTLAAQPEIGWIDDEPVNEPEEVLMLSLRTAAGCRLETLAACAGTAAAEQIAKQLAALVPAGYAVQTAEGYALTPKGMLVSNTILSELMMALD